MALVAAVYTILMASLLSTCQVSASSTNKDNDNVLQIPSVQRLMTGFTADKKPLVTEQLNEQVCDSTEEQTGEFKIKDNVGEGRYTISKDGVFLKIKMTLNKPSGVTTPTTPPTTKPTSPTTQATIATAATTVTTKATTAATTVTTKATTAATTPTTKATTVATTPTTNATSGQDCQDSPLNKEGLASHNSYRTIHNAPSMTINCDLSKKAAEYAQILADLGSLVQSGYSDRPAQGENLAMDCTSSGNTGGVAKEAVKNWYNEVCKYNFNEDGPQKATDHFTQVVWKASSELGMGAVQKQENGITCTYIVARYKPQGNFNDVNTGYKDNVLKGSFDESYCNSIKDGVGLDGGYGLKRTRPV